MTQQIGPNQNQSTPVEISAKAQAELTPRDEAQSLKTAREDLAKNPSDAKNWQRLGEEYHQLQDAKYHSKMFVCFEQCSKIDPYGPSFMLGECYFKGLGTPIDWKKAYLYFFNSAKLSTTYQGNHLDITFKATEGSYGPAVILMAKCKLLGIGTAQNFRDAYKVAQIGSTLNPQSLNVWKQLFFHFNHGLGTNKNEVLAKFCQQNIALITEGKQPQPLTQFPPPVFGLNRLQVEVQFVMNYFRLDGLTIEKLRSKGPDGTTHLEVLFMHSVHFPTMANFIWNKFKDTLTADDFNHLKNSKLLFKINGPIGSGVWDKHKDKLKIDKKLFFLLCKKLWGNLDLTHEVYQRCKDQITINDIQKPIKCKNSTYSDLLSYLVCFLNNDEKNAYSEKIILDLVSRFAVDLGADYFTKRYPTQSLLNKFETLSPQTYETIVRTLLAQTHGKITKSNLRMNTRKEVPAFLQDLEPLINARNAHFDALRLTKMRKGQKPTSEQIAKLSTLAAQAHAAGYHNAHFDLGQWFEKHGLKAQALASYAQMTAQGKKFNEGNEYAFDIAQGEALNAKDSKAQSEHIKTAMGFALHCAQNNKEKFISTMFNLYCLCFYPNRLGVCMVSLGDFGEELTKDNWERLFKAKMETPAIASDQAPVLRFSTDKPKEKQLDVRRDDTPELHQQQTAASNVRSL